MRIDHLVYATDDLARTVASLTALTGISPMRGGQHVGRGTRNELYALGDGAYLEVIGPDDDQPTPPGPRPFGIDGLARGEERLVAWCARYEGPIEAVAERLRAVGATVGALSPMSRCRPDGVLLAWKLTAPVLHDPLHDSTLPFYIDWLDSPHPTATLPPSLTLVHLSIESPHAAALTAALRALDGAVDARVVVKDGARHTLTAHVSGGVSGTLILASAPRTT